MPVSLFERFKGAQQASRVEPEKQVSKAKQSKAKLSNEKERERERGKKQQADKQDNKKAGWPNSFTVTIHDASIYITHMSKGGYKNILIIIIINIISV